MPQAKAQLQDLKQAVLRSGKSPTLVTVITECVELLEAADITIDEFPNDVDGHKLDGTGNGIRLYLPAPARQFVFRVSYSKRNLGNLVHEMTHCCVEVAYRNHFLNYPVNVAVDCKIVPRIDQHGNCLNNAAIVKALRDGAAEDTRFEKVGVLQGLFDRCEFQFRQNLMMTYNGGETTYTLSRRDSSDAFKGKLREQLVYAKGPAKEGQGGGPHIDFDTVINHLLVWMFQFGYPKQRSMFSRTEPPENLLFLQLEEYARENHELRRIHTTHNRGVMATEHDRYDRVVT